MLGLDWNGGGQEGYIGIDGFVKLIFKCANNQVGCIFKYNPVGFLKIFLNKVRKNCKNINKTYMGKFLNAVLLKEENI